MLNVFKKKEQKFYKIETDATSGYAVFNMIGNKFSTKCAEHCTDFDGNSTITFVSTKTVKEILKYLEKTFGDAYHIENNGTTISMTSMK